MGKMMISWQKNFQNNYYRKCLRRINKTTHLSKPWITCLSSRAVSRRYETMLILRPDMFGEERDRQLAKFETFLSNNGVENIDCIIKGKQKMSYPIAGYWDGIYVLFQFSGDGIIAKSVHNLLAN